MEPILDKALAGRNALEQILDAVPGFQGYREKELRRDADKLQREHLADRLEQCKKPLHEIAAQATRDGGLEAINDVETARKRLERVIARIRYAERGYGGFFDVVKVQEETLARVYAFDLALLQAVDSIVAAARAAGAGPEAGRERVRALIDQLDALDARLADRDAMLGGIA
jgi:hypothetical protein